MNSIKITFIAALIATSTLTLSATPIREPENSKFALEISNCLKEKITFPYCLLKGNQTETAVDVAFSLNEEGRATNVEVKNTDEELTKEIKRQLEKIHFEKIEESREQVYQVRIRFRAK